MESIYIAKSESFPGLVKIGRTDRPVHERMGELSRDNYGPTYFEGDSEWEAVRIIKVDDNETAEALLHDHFSDIRHEFRRELFKTDDIEALSDEAIGVVNGTDIIQTFDTADSLFASSDALFDSLGAVSLATGLIVTASIFSNHQNVKDAKEWADAWEKRVEERVSSAKTPVGKFFSNLLNLSYWSSKFIGTFGPVVVKGLKDGYHQEKERQKREMKIENYSTEHTNIDFVNAHLKNNKESRAWICGVLDFASGEINNRRSKPLLDSIIINKTFHIFGKQTFEIKDNLKEHGAKWDPNRKSWYINISDEKSIENFISDIDKALENLGKDPSEVYYPEFLLGMPWKKWIEEYDRGKEWANKNATEIQKNTTYNRMK